MACGDLTSEPQKNWIALTYKAQLSEVRFVVNAGENDFGGIRIVGSQETSETANVRRISLTDFTRLAGGVRRKQATQIRVPASHTTPKIHDASVHDHAIAGSIAHKIATQSH